MRPHLARALPCLASAALFAAFALSPVPATPASAQDDGDGFELRLGAVTCRQDPPLPPTFTGADCAAAPGVAIAVATEAGQPLGACVAEDRGELDPASGTTPIASCALVVPYATRLIATADGATAPAGSAARTNPLFPASPPPGPVGGIVSGPIFVFLPVPGAPDAPGEPTAEPTHDPGAAGSETVTVYGALCPAGYAGDDYVGACSATPAAGAGYRLGFRREGAVYPREGDATAGADGFARIEGFGALVPMASAIFGVAPPPDLGAGVQVPVAACTTEGGRAVPLTRLPPPPGGETTRVSFELDIGTGDDLRCDVYFVPHAAGPDPTATAAPAQPSATLAPAPQAPAAGSTGTVVSLPNTGAGPAYPVSGGGTLAVAGLILLAGVALSWYRRRIA